MLLLRLIAICVVAIVVVTVPPKQFCDRMEKCSTGSSYIGPQGLKGETGETGTYDSSLLEAFKSELKELKEIVANLSTSTGGTTSTTETPKAACTGYSYQNRCFVYYAEWYLSVVDSEAKCKENNGRLANIQTKELFDNLKNYIRTFEIPSWGATVHTGGTIDPTVSKPNQASWNDGSQTDISDDMWYPYMPNTASNWALYASHIHLVFWVQTDATNIHQGFANSSPDDLNDPLCEYTM